MNAATALTVGAAVGVGAVNAVANFQIGQKNDATVSSGSKQDWDRKVFGALAIQTATVPASLGTYMLSKATGVGNPGVVGFATLLGGLAGSSAGFIGSMIVD